MTTPATLLASATVWLLFAIHLAALGKRPRLYSIPLTGIGLILFNFAVVARTVPPANAPDRD